MKKNQFLLSLLSIIALLPLSASAQIQGSIPGSVDPTWTCSLSARAIYVDQNWNDIQYSVTYRMPSDFGVNTVLAADISWGSATVFQEYDVTLSPTGLGTRMVTKDGATKFHYDYNTQDDAPRQVRVSATLGEEFCGLVTVDVATNNQAQPFNAMNFNPNTNSGVGGSANTQPVQFNPPQPADPDDATAQPISNQGGSNGEMVIRDNLSPEFQPPVAGGSPEAPSPEPVAGGSGSVGAGSVGGDNAGTSVNSNDNENDADEPVVAPDRSGARVVGESSVANTEIMDSQETSTLLYALIASIGVLLAVVIYLLVRQK